MNKRIISVLSLIVVFILVLSGCNSGENTENTTIETTTLSQDVNVDVTSEAESKTETEVTTENKNETTKVKEHLTVTTAKQSVSTEKATKKPVSSSLTAEEIVDIYFKNQNVWLPEAAKEGWTMGLSYIFIDLDFDGTLELISNCNQGSGLFSTNEYFRVNKNTKKIEKIKADEEEKYDFGFDYGTIKLVRNVNTGKMKYYCCDAVRVSNYEYGADYGVMYYENNMVNTEILFAETFTGAGAYEGITEDIEKFYYHVGERSVEITKEDYDNRVNAFFAENKDLNLKFEAVDGYEFGDATPSQQKAMLLKGYKAFSYNK